MVRQNKRNLKYSGAINFTRHHKPFLHLILTERSFKLLIAERVSNLRDFVRRKIVWGSIIYWLQMSSHLTQFLFLNIKKKSKHLFLSFYLYSYANNNNIKLFKWWYKIACKNVCCYLVGRKPIQNISKLADFVSVAFLGC